MTSTNRRTLALQSVQAAGSQLSMRFSFEKYQFSLCYWYDFDLEELDGMYGSQSMQKIYAHCAAFSIIHLCSLNPDVLDWGPCSRWHTAEFERVWKTAWKGLSGQWRFENDLPQAKPPVFASEPSPPTAPATLQSSKRNPTTLVFFGGGKDSLVMYDLFSKAGIPFSTLTCSHTIFGRSTIQQQLSDKVLEKLQPHSKGHVNHKVCMLEDFLDSPVLLSLGKKLRIKSLILSEVPPALFASLPVVLYYGYASITMGNERSSNAGNLLWESTGEEINHQWQKANESEVLFCNYIQQELISNVHFFSALQPIHDAVIFSIAESCMDIAVHTHSCNMHKPWCKHCPKCCYVWLMFMAYFPCDVINSMFQGDNLKMKNVLYKCLAWVAISHLSALEKSVRQGWASNSVDAKVYKDVQWKYTRRDSYTHSTALLGLLYWISIRQFIHLSRAMSHLLCGRSYYPYSSKQQMMQDVNLKLH